MKTPDIEIYVKDVNLVEIKHWLEQHFSSVIFPNHFEQIFQKGKTVRASASTDTETSELIITPQAAGKSFASIWFKSNNTKWENDEACAQSLLDLADVEVRCSASGWTEEEAIESEQWLLMTRAGKKLINWG